MLTAEQVHPFLFHDEEPVRELALEYFGGSAIGSVISADDLWVVFDRFGVSGRFDRAMSKATHSAGSIARLVETIATHQLGNEPYAFMSTFRRLPIEHIAAIASEPKAWSKVTKRTKATLEQRRLLANESHDALWEQLVMFARRLETERKSALSVEDGSVFVEALARFGTVASTRALELLSSPKTPGSWLEVYLVDLLGLLREEAAIPYILDLIGQEGDFVNEHAVEAIGRIGTPTLAAEIADRYATAAEPFRSYVTSGLSAMRTPAAETALIRILEQVKGDTSQVTYVADDLCCLCTTSGLSILLEIAESREYDDTIVSLDEEVLALAIMQGVNVPWADECRKARAQRERTLSERFARLVSLDRALPAEPPKPRQWVSTSKKRKGGQKKGK